MARLVTKISELLISTYVHNENALSNCFCITISITKVEYASPRGRRINAVSLWSFQDSYPKIIDNQKRFRSPYCKKMQR